jgi:hypothetical protein
MQRHTGFGDENQRRLLRESPRERLGEHDRCNASSASLESVFGTRTVIARPPSATNAVGLNQVEAVTVHLRFDPRGSGPDARVHAISPEKR